MPSLILSNPLGTDDAQEIGLTPREYAVGEVITVDDYVFATLVRTGYGKPYGAAEEILVVGDGDPTEAVGVDGQWYLDKQTETLWGPKVGGYWPSDPIRPDRGVSSWRIDANYHLIVTYSTGTVVDLGDIRGPEGQAATIEVGDVTTLPTGTPANVINSGTANAARLDFELPMGADGAQGPPGEGYGGGLVVAGNDPDPLAATIVSNWGLRADGSTYYDPAGALPDEAALLVPDAEVGEFTLFRPGAPALTLTAERVRDIVLDPAGPILADLDARFASEDALSTAVADLNTAIGDLNTAVGDRVQVAQIGQPDGVAGLDADGTVPFAQLPDTILTESILGTDQGLPGRDRGTGTNLPATDLRRGDIYSHTALGLLVYNGGAWRQATGRHQVTDDAAVTALSATYAALLHEGYAAYSLATDTLFVWDGAVWYVSLRGPDQGEVWEADYGAASGQAFADATNTPVAWANQLIAAPAIVRREAGNTMFTILKDGVYAITASLRFSGGAAAMGERFVGLMMTTTATGVATPQSGTGLIASAAFILSASAPSSGQVTTPALTMPGRKLLAGQQFQVQAYASGGAGAGSSTTNWSRLHIARIR